MGTPIPCWIPGRAASKGRRAARQEMPRIFFGFSCQGFGQRCCSAGGQRGGVLLLLLFTLPKSRPLRGCPATFRPRGGKKIGREQRGWSWRSRSLLGKEPPRRLVWPHGGILQGYILPKPLSTQQGARNISEGCRGEGKAASPRIPWQQWLGGCVDNGTGSVCSALICPWA